MTIAAIPTMYEGVQFRSRLEARWAAFFDLLRWPWEYEPIDLAGYIPDFVLQFSAPMIVEVKPLIGNVNRWSESGDGEVAIKKALASGWIGEGLLVGATLHTDKLADGVVDYGEPTNAGVLFSAPPLEGMGPEPYASPFGFAECCGGPIDCIGSYHCRRCGHYDGNNGLRPSNDITSLWREAGNRVQWRGRAQRTGLPSHVHQRHVPPAPDDWQFVTDECWRRDP
jgi:hypothetical protein